MTYKEWYSKYVDNEEVVMKQTTSSKKQKSYQKWYNELTEEEKHAIYSYTTSDYHDFNNIKRFGLDKALTLLNQQILTLKKNI